MGCRTRERYRLVEISLHWHIQEDIDRRYRCIATATFFFIFPPSPPSDDARSSLGSVVSCRFFNLRGSRGVLRRTHEPRVSREQGWRGRFRFQEDTSKDRRLLRDPNRSALRWFYAGQRFSILDYAYFSLEVLCLRVGPPLFNFIFA